MAKLRDTARRGITMVLRIFRGFDQFVEDMLRRGMIRIPHAEVDDVFAGLPSLEFQRLNFIEHIRRQPVDPVEAFFGGHGGELT